MSVDVKEQYTEDEIAYMKFFDHWHQIDIIKSYSSEEHHELFTTHYRWQIVNVLALGVEDEYPGKGKRIRHALNGKEIMDQLLEKHNSTISKSNFYFHMKALIEGGAVQIVGTKGKRETKYFGRTAKAFLVEDKNKKLHPILKRDYFKEKILKKLNPDITDDQIDSTLLKLEPLMKYEDNYFKDWVEKYQKTIFDIEELDIRYLANFASILYRYNTKSGKGIQELNKLLKLEKIENANRDIEEVSEGRSKDYRELSTSDLFDFWDTLPPVRLFSDFVYKSNFDYSQKNKQESVMLRMLIITLLKEGRKELNPATNQIEQRNLLMASEILEDLKTFSEKYNKPIDIGSVKPSALYFHLDKMEKSGLIQTVGYVNHGLKKISYYGRTAKYYTYNERINEEDTYPILKSEGLKDLVLRMGGALGVTKFEFEDTIQKISKINNYDPLALPLWLRETKIDMQDIKIREADLGSEEVTKNVDLVEIATIISICQRFTPDVIEGLNRLANWLQFPQAD